MTNKTVAHLAMVIIALGCGSPKVEESAKAYDDIDLLHLRGIGPLDALNYPYILVDSVDKNKRILIACYTKDKQDTAIYSFDGVSWNSDYSFWADTGTMTIATRIYPNWVTRLTYGGDSSRKLLTSVSIFEGMHRRSLGLKTPKEESSPAFDSLKASDSLTFYTEESFEQTGDMLKDIMHTRDNMYDKTSDSTICYPVGKHSVFWWLVFEKDLEGTATNCR
jgi:hypothetical protein